MKGSPQIRTFSKPTATVQRPDGLIVRLGAAALPPVQSLLAGLEALPRERSGSGAKNSGVKRPVPQIRMFSDRRQTALAAITTAEVNRYAERVPARMIRRPEQVGFPSPLIVSGVGTFAS